MDRQPTTKPSSTNRAKVTNDPLFLAGHSARTPSGRRRRDLVAAYATALGGLASLTELQAADVRRAAELVALAEEARALALRDPAAVDLGNIIRLEGAADRAVRRLNIKPGQASAPMTMRERLLSGAA